MDRITVDADDEETAKLICFDCKGWIPDAIREVDSGEEGVRAWMCFESAADAELWDKQV